MRTSQPVPFWQVAPDPAEIAPLTAAVVLVGAIVGVVLLAGLVDAWVQHARRRQARATATRRADWFWSPLEEPRFEVAVHVPTRAPARVAGHVPAEAPAPVRRQAATPVSRVA